MKKCIYLVLVLLVMLASVSCKKSDAIKGEEQSTGKKVDMEFTATSEGTLKTTVKSDGTTVVWSEGDAIKVFSNYDYQGGELTLTSGAGKTTAKFSGRCSESGPWYAVYPSSSVNSFNDGEIDFTVPAVQTYAGATFAKGMMPCVAYSATTDLNFKHSFGVLKLNLTGEGLVKSIKVKDNDNEVKLNGTFTVYPASDEVAVKLWNNGTNSITLDCGNGVALDSNKDTEFWIVVPQGAFKQGFEVFITSTDGKVAEFSTANDNSIFAGQIKPMPTKEVVFSATIPERCSASDYEQVTIDTQVWMAENYRCSKYDTESEAYKEGVYTVNYIDASDKSLWHSKKWAGNLTDEQIEKFGYLYSWDAAVGLVGKTSQTAVFSGNRQGVCPNEWHVPSKEEWQTLVKYIEETDGKGTGTAGKYLKTDSGWYDSGNGNDAYNFSALPTGSYAGLFEGGDIDYIGYRASFWSADIADNGYAYLRSIHYNCDDLSDGSNLRINGYSVRCLKN
ncbi:MAG: hypothetical protein MJ010_07365 [Paludibacteraceae bacterium]|nr:hypothetical protein [Paludibacteraceae bacterium]